MYRIDREKERDFTVVVQFIQLFMCCYTESISFSCMYRMYHSVVFINFQDCYFILFYGMKSAAVMIES